MHVPEQVGSKAPGRVDLRIGILPDLFDQPVWPLVGEQQGDVMCRHPISGIGACGLKLERVQCKPLKKIASRELKERCVQPNDPNALPADCQRRGKVAGQQTISNQCSLAKGCLRPPMCVVGKGGSNDLSIFACRLGLEISSDFVEYILTQHL